MSTRGEEEHLLRDCKSSGYEGSDVLKIVLFVSHDDGLNCLARDRCCERVTGVENVERFQKQYLF
jgi:hypothetical protein